MNFDNKATLQVILFDTSLYIKILLKYASSIAFSIISTFYINNCYLCRKAVKLNTSDKKEINYHVSYHVLYETQRFVELKTS